MKKILKINEYNTTNFEISDICELMYSMLNKLLRSEYVLIYSSLYNSKDMLYQIFRDYDDVEEFLSNIKSSVDNKDFYGIYDPINKIIGTLINNKYKK